MLINEIKIEVEPGDTIHDVAMEMSKLAKFHECKVNGTFNGSVIYASPFLDVHQIVEAWLERRLTQN